MLNQMHNIENLKKYPIGISLPKGTDAVSIVQPLSNAKSGFITMKEIWKDIKGYEGYYQASNLGRIKSLARKTNNQYGDERILKASFDTRGYLQVSLCKNGTHKSVKIHKLTWETFSENQKTNENQRIDHIDEIKINNRFSNLQLLSHRENICKSIKFFKKRKLPTGVYCGKSGNYRTAISINNKYHSLGTYKTIIEAENKYKEKLKQIENDKN